MSNFFKKGRSCTIGACDVLTAAAEHVSCRQPPNLVVSPVSSAESGMGVPARKRSATWHAAPIYSNQVDLKGARTDECLDAQTGQTLKEKLSQVIVQELSEHLENEVDLTSGQEFVKKSALISKVISTRARQLAGCNTKIVSSVFIGEIRGDGIEVASQCLFDPTQDAFASGNFKSSHIFAIGTLFVAMYNAS